MIATGLAKEKSPCECQHISTKPRWWGRPGDSFFRNKSPHIGSLQPSDASRGNRIPAAITSREGAHFASGMDRGPRRHKRRHNANGRPPPPALSALGFDVRIQLSRRAFAKSNCANRIEFSVKCMLASLVRYLPPAQNSVWRRYSSVGEPAPRPPHALPDEIFDSVDSRTNFWQTL